MISYILDFLGLYMHMAACVIHLFAQQVHALHRRGSLVYVYTVVHDHAPYTKEQTYILIT